MANNKVQEIAAVDFYNLIAEDYDSKLNISKDNKIRKDVLDYMTSLNITNPKVLDFGGGTGLDIDQILTTSDELYFYEPSEGMRSVAIEKNKKIKNTTFLETDFNFDDLKLLDTLPKFDIILLNFGVINYLSDLKKSFSLFNHLLADNGVLLVNRLYIPRRLKYLKTFIKLSMPIMKGKGPLLASKQGQHIHTTHIYSLSKIKRESNQYFEIKQVVNLGEKSDFQLIHFKKA